MSPQVAPGPAPAPQPHRDHLRGGPPPSCAGHRAGSPMCIVWAPPLQARPPGMARIWPWGLYESRRETEKPRWWGVIRKEHMVLLNEGHRRFLYIPGAGHASSLPFPTAHPLYLRCTATSTPASAGLPGSGCAAQPSASPPPRQLLLPQLARGAKLPSRRAGRPARRPAFGLAAAHLHGRQSLGVGGR